MSETEEELVTVTLPRRLGKMGLSKARTERKDPLLLLPEEIWRVILHEVKEWEDVWSCSDTCTLFRRLIQESTSLRPFKIYAAFGKLLPHLYAYLNGGEILRCRAVCRVWNQQVDGFFENDKFLRPHNDMESDPRHGQFVSLLKKKGLGGLYGRVGNPREDTWTWTRTMLRENQAWNFVGIQRRNPFIGRDVIVSSNYPELEACLEAYGKHIWYLTVCFPGDGNPEDANAIRLLRMVTVKQDRFFPNLRRLCIAARRDYILVPRCTIDLASMPLAPHLETLQIKGSFNYMSPPTSVELLLRKYHLQLGRLDVRLNDHLRLVSQLEWPKLTELNLDGHFTYGGIRHYELLLQTKMPNLSKLALGPLCPFPMEASWSELLEFIGKLSLSTRLSTLRIPAPGENPPGTNRPTSTGDYSWTALNTLKTFELWNQFSESSRYWYGCPRFRYHFTTYSFLRRFPFLENLNIFWRSDNPSILRNTDDIRLHRKEDPMWKMALAATQAADFLDDDDGLEVNKYLYRGEMYKSNIWEVLPRLKVLTFQMKCYTRDGYDKFRMTKQN